MVLAVAPLPVVVDGLLLVTALLGVVVGKRFSAVVDALVVDMALLLVVSLIGVVVITGATSQVLSELALPLARAPYAHTVQFKQ